MAAMMNIKFQNIVVEIIIENHDKIFGEAPDLSVPLPQAPSSRSTPRRSKAICLSSGKRRARLYPPALCLADNDSDTFSSSSSTTPMGSQESLSSHSSEKNGLSQTSPPSSPAAEPSSPSSKQSSPPAASSCSLPQNGKGQKPPTDSASSPHLLPSASWTSTQLTPTQQTSSVSSSTSSLLSAVEKSIKRNSVESLASGKESGSPSRASTSTSSAQNSSVERASSLREAGPVQRVASVSSLKSTHSVEGRNAPSATVTDTKVSDSTSPRQLRTAYRTASSSSSSSSSLFPYRLSTSSSLTSLHISEDYKSCHGSVQSLMSLDPQEATHMRKSSSIRCGSDLTSKHSVSSNGYQRPGSLLSARLPQRESSIFSSALDVCSNGRDAKALYSCEAEHSHELSFPQGALFSNVCPSVEPGWLQATYNGRTGLVPENYITYM